MQALLPLLKDVSRSFYLSIRVLPAPVRGQVALAYLLARAADTLADTEAVAGPAGDDTDERRRLLGLLRATVTEDGAAGAEGPLLDALRPHLARAPWDGDDGELRLLRRLPECLAAWRQLGAADRGLVGRVLEQLTRGMLRDLERFPARRGPVPPDAVVALPTLADLDEYTYLAAGCVGEFWTDITAAHLPEVAHLRAPALRQRGVSLGKALQMVNVLRDSPADLRMGRCYWPQDLLAECGVAPAELAALAQGRDGPREGALGATRRLERMALDLARAAWPYVQAIPARALRLRLACVWPLLLGLDTLRAIRAAGSPLLLPERPIKVRRQQVYALVLRSGLAAALDGTRGLDLGGGLDLLYEARCSGLQA